MIKYNLNDDSDINGENLSYKEVLDIIIRDCSLSEVFNYIYDLKLNEDYKYLEEYYDELLKE